ncbi:hypothetical protein PR048_006250 [Dryococelus australis]|uniref:CCHC-type domain-containing protein n=1 Tax=Dryococelus australis TaxID=614101 RepID=A0ABQ9IBP5_9NEOP|nr:hypothetical protein PR048_006250 [Dryococelus australis]
MHLTITVAGRLHHLLGYSAACSYTGDAHASDTLTDTKRTLSLQRILSAMNDTGDTLQKLLVCGNWNILVRSAHTTTTEETQATNILAAVDHNSQASTTELACGLGISQASIGSILQLYRFHCHGNHEVCNVPGRHAASPGPGKPLVSYFVELKLYSRIFVRYVCRPTFRGSISQCCMVPSDAQICANYVHRHVATAKDASVCPTGLLLCVRENCMFQASAPREEQLMPLHAVLYHAYYACYPHVHLELVCSLLRHIAEVMMASTVTVEDKEIDLQEAFNHLAYRLEGLECGNSDLKRQVLSTPVNLNGDSACQEAENYEVLFGRKHTTHFYLEQLSRLKIFDNESVEEFSMRMTNKAIDAFLNGLKGEIGKFTHISRPQIFKEALESAINVVEADKHPGKEQDTSVKSSGKSVFAVERKGDKCFFCHNVGHKIKDCSNRAKACFGCGQIGHLVRVCPGKGKQSKVSYAPIDKNGMLNSSGTGLAMSHSPICRPLKLLTDTGTEVSLMWQHVGDLDLQCLQEQKFVVSGFSGHKLNNLGEIVVVQNDCTRYDGIIGLDFLKQYQALVKVAEQSLQLGNKLYSLGQCTDGPTSRVKDCCMGYTTQPLQLRLLSPQSVTTVMPHEGKVEAPANMSRAEVEIPRGTQIAVLELLKKGDVLSCPCDVDESVVRKLSHLSGEDKQLLESLLQEYQHIFRDRKNLPIKPLVQHTIYTGNHKPISMKPYCVVPFDQQTLVHNMIKQLQSGFIVPREPSDPPWAFPVIARNKSETGDIKYRVYKHVSLPYGLIDGPATFQKLMDSVLRGLTPTQCIVYIDVIVFSRHETALTDHAALKWVLRLTDPCGRLMRWSLQLSEYVYKIQHRPAYDPVVSAVAYKKLSTPRHPQGNGRTKHLHWKIAKMISHYLAKAKLAIKLCDVWKSVKHRNHSALLQQEVQYNKKSVNRQYKVDDLVYLSNAVLKKNHVKFQQDWKGQYPVIEPYMGPATLLVSAIDDQDRPCGRPRKLPSASPPVKKKLGPSAKTTPDPASAYTYRKAAKVSPPNSPSTPARPPISYNQCCRHQ